MEKQLDEVRLQMLKNQINPHFLFNTLNMIASTAQIEDADTTEKMIHALSRLFRYNLKSTDSVMPLERELKVVQDYMYIQQMRFGSRVSHNFRVEVDGRNEKIGKKIREATLEKIPYMLVVGDRDMENQTVSVRLRTGEDLGAMSVADFAARLKQDVDTKAIW